MSSRRRFLAGGASVALGALAGCGPPPRAELDGAWIGASLQRGHRLRAPAPRPKSGAPADPAVVRRVGALVVGAGIAGLSAARALQGAGVDDVHVLELEDTAGGNSRGHTLAGMRCPLGAHYLPLPGEQAVEVAELLEAFGVRRLVAGRAVYDERMLCHSPQERLFIAGGWRDGLLPPVDALPAGERSATLAQYHAFSAAVTRAGDRHGFELPTARARWNASLDALDATTFADWLDRAGLVAPALRWYLDYCCRDDYGAGSRQVSAWAGIHYFASRHGFAAPGETGDGHAADGGSGVLTWPEGNAWLAERLAAPLGERLHPARIAMRVDEQREGVAVDAWNAATDRAERWLAARVVLAVPLFIAARLLVAPPPALAEAVRTGRHAPWLVANLQLDEALADRPGAPPSWDNVRYGGPGLGYVDAMHQSTRSVAGPTVLTSYWALGGDDAGELAAGRASLSGDDWRPWANRVVADLALAHDDLPAKLRRIELMRYGHAMRIPLPGTRSSAALAALAAPQRRVEFAHADLAGYSVFEEACFHGVRAGRAAARALRG